MSDNKYLEVSNNIGYCIMKEEHKEGCFENIKFYNDHEVLAKTLQMSAEKRKIQWEQMWPHLVNSEFSIVAIDLVKNKVIGAYFGADMVDLKPAYENPNEWNDSPVHQLQMEMERKMPEEMTQQPRGKV